MVHAPLSQVMPDGARGTGPVVDETSGHTAYVDLTPLTGLVVTIIFTGTVPHTASPGLSTPSCILGRNIEI